MVRSKTELLAEGMMALHTEGKPLGQPASDRSSAAALPKDTLWQRAIQKLAESKYPELRTWETTPEGREAFLAEAEEHGVGEDAAVLVDGLR